MSATPSRGSSMLPRGADRERVDVGGQQRRVARVGSADARPSSALSEWRTLVTWSRAQTSDRWHGDLEHLRREGLIALTPAAVGRSAHGPRHADADRPGPSSNSIGTSRAGEAIAELSTRAWRSHARPRTTRSSSRVYAAAARAPAGQRRPGPPRRHGLRAEAGLPALPAGPKRATGDGPQDDRIARPRRSARGPTRTACRSCRTACSFRTCASSTSTPDGRLDREDLELATGHYNSRQMAAKQASGFQIHRSGASQLRGAARASRRIARSTRMPRNGCCDDRRRSDRRGRRLRVHASPGRVPDAPSCCTLESACRGSTRPLPASRSARTRANSSSA